MIRTENAESAEFAFLGPCVVRVEHRCCAKENRSRSLAKFNRLFFMAYTLTEFYENVSIAL